MKKTVAILLLLTLLSACSNSNSFDLADYQELTIGDVLAEIPKVWQSTPEESYEYYFEAQSCRLDFGVVENELVFKMAHCENKDDYKKMIDTISFDEAIIQLETEGKLSRDKYVSLYDGGEYIEGLVITDAGIMNYYETPDSAMIFNPEADYYTLDTIQGQHVIPKPMLVEENISPALWFHTQHRFMTGYHYNDYYFLYTDYGFADMINDTATFDVDYLLNYNPYHSGDIVAYGNYIESDNKGTLKQFQNYSHDKSFQEMLNENNYQISASGGVYADFQSLFVEIENNRGCYVMSDFFNDDLINYRCNPDVDRSWINPGIIDPAKYLDVSYDDFLAGDEIKNQVAYYQPSYNTDSNNKPQSFSSRAEAVYLLADNEKVIEIVYKDHNHTSLPDARMGHNVLARFQVYYYNTAQLPEISLVDYNYLQENDFSISMSDFKERFEEYLFPYSYFEDHMNKAVVNYAFRYKDICFVVYTSSGQPEIYVQQLTTYPDISK